MLSLLLVSFSTFFFVSVMSDLIIFWHRKDLRVSDNLGLSKAREQSNRVSGCFCFDLIS